MTQKGDREAEFDYVSGINNNGLITIVGRLRGETHSYVLTPISLQTEQVTRETHSGSPVDVHDHTPLAGARDAVRRFSQAQTVAQAADALSNQTASRLAAITMMEIAAGAMGAGREGDPDAEKYGKSIEPLLEKYGGKRHGQSYTIPMRTKHGRQFLIDLSDLLQRLASSASQSSGSMAQNTLSISELFQINPDGATAAPLAALRSNPDDFKFLVHNPHDVFIEPKASKPESQKRSRPIHAIKEEGKWRIDLML